MIRSPLFIFMIVSVPLQGLAQSFLNGDFEINTAPSGIDQLDLSNAGFNALIADCNSFGGSGSEIDLITTSVWGGPPQSGNWYIGLRGGGLDQFSLTLSQPLSAGTTYAMSFYDSGHPNNCTSPVQIGLSPTDDAFGTLVYTAPYSPEPGTWNPRIAVFTVPFDCLFVTVRSLDATCWIRVDNFCIDTTCLAEIPVTQLVMPNVFTPGGDDVNDVFLPVEASYVEEASLVVLNRWGEKVFETQDLSAGWDGSVSGKPVDDGTYFWIIEYTDALKERKGMHGFVEVRRQL